MRDRVIIRIARFMSGLFSPFYMPLLGFFALFSFTYLRLLSPSYKLYTLGVVYCFTILFPRIFIYLYRKLNGWSNHELDMRKRRMIPYALAIISYLCCYYLMQKMHMPHYMSGIIIAALMIQILCAIINFRWKISTHTAAAGGLVGTLVAFSLIFGFNPIKWFCFLIFLSGIVGSSRIILRRHSLGQVSVGFLIGLFCGFCAIYYI